MTLITASLAAGLAGFVLATYIERIISFRKLRSEMTKKIDRIDPN